MAFFDFGVTTCKTTKKWQKEGRFTTPVPVDPKELDELKPEALAKVYDLITELKRINQAKKNKPTAAAADYIKVREALKQCKGSLSEDIMLEREDRI